MWWYFSFRCRYHQRSQFFLPKSTRDMPRLAHICGIHRNDQTVFTAWDNDLLRRVWDCDAQDAREDCIVPIVVVNIKFLAERARYERIAQVLSEVREVNVLYRRCRMRCTLISTGKTRPHHTTQIPELLNRGTFDACCLGNGKRKIDCPALQHRGAIGSGDSGEVERSDWGHSIGCGVVMTPSCDRQ